MGIAIEDQRSSSTFRFEEGRGIITEMKVRRGAGNFNSDKCVLVVSIQRVGKDGRPTEDDVVEEELTIGKLAKFHPGHASTADDQDPQDLGEDGEGNCIYAMEGAHPDPKAKASSFGKSLQESGVRPALLNGYCPNLIGIDANWSREMVKYSGLTSDKGGEAEGSNLIVKKGEGNILNLSDINRRDKQAAGTAKGSAKPATQPAAAAAAPVAAPAPVQDGGGEAAAKAVELLQAMQGKAEQATTRAKLGNKMVTLLAAKRVPPALHTPVQALVKDKEWLDETLETLGWAVAGDTITIPAAQ